MLTRISIWGAVFGICGGALGDLNSYDTTEGAALRGAIAGLALGICFGFLIQSLATQMRRRQK